MKLIPEVENYPYRSLKHIDRLIKPIAYFYRIGDRQPAYFVDVFDNLITFLELFLFKKLDAEEDLLYETNIP